MKYLKILAESTHPSQRDMGYLPYILMTIGSIIWPLSWIYPNQNNINFAQASMIRGMTNLLISYLMCIYFKTPTSITDTSSHKYLHLRSFLNVLHGFGFAISQFILPLPLVHTINSTSVFFVFIIDYFLNNVRINYKQLVGIIIGIFGAALATNGQLIIKYFDPSYEMKTKFQNYITDDPFIRTLCSLALILNIIFFALGSVLTKRVKANTFQNNFVLGSWMLLFGAVMYPYIQSKCSKISLFISLFTLGFPLVVGQWALISSLTMTKNTGKLIMISFFSIFVGYLISIFRYGEDPNFVTIFGIVLVFIGVYRTIFNKELVK